MKQNKITYRIEKLILGIVAIFLSSCGTRETPLNLGNGYSLRYNSNSYFVISDSNQTYIINEHITKFGFDSIFIVAEQLSIDSICECNSNCNNSPKKKLNNCKQAIRNYTNRNYWIIDKKYSSMYGPFMYENYKKCKQKIGCLTKLDRAFPSAYMHYLNQENIFLISNYKTYHEYLDSLNNSLEK